MSTPNHPQGDAIFEFYSPYTDPIGIVSIPHSGEIIPPEFHQFLSGNKDAYNEDVDYKVHELVDIEQLRQNGLFVIVSNIHRITVDLNRSEDLAVLNWKKNTQGVELVSVEPSDSEREDLLNKYHRPYFEMIKGILTDLESKFEKPVSFVDLHSMPSKPTAYHMKQNPMQKQTRPDFCLSDQHGKTCVPEFIDSITQDLKNFGYSALKNDPYIGGYVTVWADGFKTNNIQIEIKREIYMDEIKKELVANKVEKLRPLLTEALIKLFKKFY